MIGGDAGAGVSLLLWLLTYAVVGAVAVGTLVLIAVALRRQHAKRNGP